MSRKFEIIKQKNLPDEAQISGFSFLKEPTDKDKEKKKFDFYEFSNQNEIGCMLPKRNAPPSRLMISKMFTSKSKVDCSLSLSY